MSEERNDQTPNDEPPPVTPDILEKGEDAEGEKPPSATQDVMQCAEEPPKAKQDIMMKFMTRVDLKELAKEAKKEVEGEGEEEE